MKTTGLELSTNNSANDPKRKGKGRFEFLNPRIGFAMMMDWDVAVSRKAVALLCGIAMTALLVIIEVPLDLVVATIPGLGLILDFLFNGSEALLAPLLFACILLPRIVDERTIERYQADEPLPPIEA